MMVSTKGRYALNIMMDLANNQGDEFVSMADISDRLNLSMKYLEIVVGILNKGGLVESHRGKNGGYRLARDPADYNINEILELTEGSLAPVECVKEEKEPCNRAGHCVTLPLWQGLDGVIEEYLSSFTLQDIIDGRIEGVH